MTVVRVPTKMTSRTLQEDLMTSRLRTAMKPTVFTHIQIIFFLVVVYAITTPGVTDAQPRLDHNIGAFLDSLIIEHNIPGLSFAVFNDHEILFEHTAGIKNQNTKEPIDAETTFEAASISKPLFAYLVLSLSHQGFLDLDAPITQFSDLTHDNRFSRLTPRVLLSHQSGLPNWRSRLNFDARKLEELFPPTDTLQFRIDPGTNFMYSGEGYVLLQRMVEKTMGKGLNTLAQEIVFQPLGMTRSSFLYDEHIRSNTSAGHNKNMDPDKWEILVALSSSTLHTTASDVARFGIHVVNELKNKEHMKALASPAVQVEREGESVKSWGLGLGLVQDEHGKYMYHGGNNVIFIADFIYGFQENLGYVVLTNSANGAAIVEDIEKRVLNRDIVR